MKTYYYLILLSIIVAGSCKRSSSCDDRDRDEYYDIPVSTKPFILNKKGEILVFANSKGDSVEFLCTEESHNYKLFSNSNQGSADCPIIVKKYVESYNFFYKGDTAFFGFMRIAYSVHPDQGLPILTDFDINVSDSIISNTTLDGLLIKLSTDSILFSGQYFLGTYSLSKNILYNRKLGVIKFIDNQNRSWQLFQKK